MKHSHVEDHNIVKYVGHDSIQYFWWANGKYLMKIQHIFLTIFIFIICISSVLFNFYYLAKGREYVSVEITG